MITMSRRIHGFLAINIALVVLRSAVAQSSAPTVTITTEQPNIFLGDTAIIQVVVLDAPDASQPTLETPARIKPESFPRQDNSSHFVSIVNGRRIEHNETRFVYPFRVTPTSAGTVTIGPARLTIEGVEYVTDTLTLTVSPPVPRDDMRLALMLDKESGYVGEPILLTLTWSILSNVSDYSFSIPPLETSIEVYDAPAPTPTAQDIRSGRYLNVEFLGSTVSAERGVITLGGQSWTTLTVRKILIPTAPGEFTIGPGMIRANIQVGRRRSGFFGDDPVYSRAVVPSQSVALRVEPLPEDGKPNDFSGLVGDYHLAARLARDEMKVGDPVLLTIRISGSSPIDRAPIAELLNQPAMKNAFFVAPDESTTRIENGSLILEINARPINEQIDELPSLSLSYFDPVLGAYKIARSTPQRVVVNPTRFVTLDDAVGADVARPAAIESNSGGLAHIFITEDVLSDREFDPFVFLRSPITLAVGAAPPAFWMLASGVILARRRFQSRATASISKLIRAVRTSVRTAETAGAIGVALRMYLQLRFDASPTTAPEDARRMLNQHGSDAGGSMHDLLVRCDESAFARRQDGDMEALRTAAITLIDSIERNHRRDNA